MLAVSVVVFLIGSSPTLWIEVDGNSSVWVAVFPLLLTLEDSVVFGIDLAFVEFFRGLRSISSHPPFWASRQIASHAFASTLCTLSRPRVTRSIPVQMSKNGESYKAMHSPLIALTPSSPIYLISSGRTSVAAAAI